MIKSTTKQFYNHKEICVEYFY